jgi:electron transfer flavoprotein alpha subunit
MSGTMRINPRRAASIGPTGLRRVAVPQRVSDTPRPSEKPLRTALKPQLWFMAIAHSDRGRLDERARQAIAAAAILASPETGVIAVVLGELSEELGSAGADVVVVFPDLDSIRFQPDREVQAISAMIEIYAPQQIFIPDTASGDGDLGRRLIAHLGVSAATHVRALDTNHVTVEWSAGAACAHAALPQVVLLSAGAVDGDVPFAGAGKQLEYADIAKPQTITGLCRDLGLVETASSAIALDDADFIVSAGNGVRNVATLEELAHALGAAVGASRVAVDEGKFGRDKQIGATGISVSASAYLAVGISGAVQHLEGIKSCRHVIAINTDTGAPIVKRADLTIIGDAEDVMQALVIRIAQARAQRQRPEET